MAPASNHEEDRKVVCVLYLKSKQRAEYLNRPKFNLVLQTSISFSDLRVPMVFVKVAGFL